AYLPNDLVNGFYNELKENYADSTHRLVTVSKHWLVAQKVVSSLNIDSKDFYIERTKFYNYYRDKKWSPDYIGSPPKVGAVMVSASYNMLLL
ncbi:MAG: hypothetical protein JNL11_11880, partial [Bdellovibrionaceae bacterium]|nr:hypothetical protein [Pseudobdellovibrionaceae bacterium]